MPEVSPAGFLALTRFDESLQNARSVRLDVTVSRDVLKRSAHRERIMDNARRFLDQVDSDPSLQAKMDAVGWKATEAVTVAAAAGFSVTAAELRAASSA